jgi:hypothetical protein
MVLCLTIGPKQVCRTCDPVLPLSVSGIVSLNLSNSDLHLLPCLPVPCSFPSIMCIRGQLLCKKWPVQLPFLCFILSRKFLSSSTLWNTSLFHVDSIHQLLLYTNITGYICHTFMIHIRGHIPDTCVQHTVTKHYTFLFHFICLILGMVLCVGGGGGGVPSPLKFSAYVFLGSWPHCFHSCERTPENIVYSKIVWNRSK